MLAHSPSYTPKDTLLTLNTLPGPSRDGAIACARPCIAPPHHLSLQQPCGRWYEDKRLVSHYPINFVVKHPTLSLYRESPPWGGGKPAGINPEGPARPASKSASP